MEAQLGPVELVLVTSGSQENCQVLGCRVLVGMWMQCEVIAGNSFLCFKCFMWVGRGKFRLRMKRALGHENYLRHCSIVLEIRVEHGSSGRYSF